MIEVLLDVISLILIKKNKEIDADLEFIIQMEVYLVLVEMVLDVLQIFLSKEKNQKEITVLTLFWKFSKIKNFRK